MAGFYRVVAPDRYITTEPVSQPLVVRHGNHDILRTTHAVKVCEGARDPVIYVPMDASPAGLLESSTREYYCRWKGDATFFNVRVGDTLITDGAWRYPRPPGDLASIRDHVAFDASAFVTLIDLVSADDRLPA